MAKSAKAKAATVQLLDKRPRQRLTECTAKAEEARFVSSFRRSISKHVRRLVSSQRRGVAWYLEVIRGPFLVYSWTHKHTYLLLTVRRSNAPTSTSHRFDSELNRLAAEMGCKGSEEGRNGPVLGQTVQARLPPYCAPAREASNQLM